MNVEKSLKYVFHVLSRCPKGAASSARIHIPDTLFYEHGTLQFWYRYDPDTHEIVRKDRRECSTDMIYEALGLEGRGVDASLRASSVATMLAGGYNVNFPDVPVAVLLSARFVVPGYVPGDPRKDPDNHRLRKEARRRARAGQSTIRKHAVPLELVDDDDSSSVDSDDSRGGVSQPKQVIAETFLDRPGIDSFLNGNDLKHHSLLQKYPLGRSLHATTVEAVYSPQVIHITQRQNKRFLSDVSVSLYERCVTNESCPHLVESIQISTKAKELVENDCRNIADHILAVENRCVARMVCYFSFETCEDMPDEPGGVKPLLLWVSELHLSKEVPKEQVRRTLTTFTDRKLMQLQPETIPGLMIGPGQRKKRADYLREKEKYLPYAVKVGAPSVDEGRGGTDRILSSLDDRQYRKMCEKFEQFRTPQGRTRFHRINTSSSQHNNDSSWNSFSNNNDSHHHHQTFTSVSMLSRSNQNNSDINNTTPLNNNHDGSNNNNTNLTWSNSPFAHLINKLEREKLAKLNKNKSSEDQIKELIIRASSSSSGKRSQLLPSASSPDRSSHQHHQNHHLSPIHHHQSPGANNNRSASTPPPRHSFGKQQQQQQNTTPGNTYNNQSTSTLPRHIKTQSQLELHFLAKGSRNLLCPVSELVQRSAKKGLLMGHDNPSYVTSSGNSPFSVDLNNNNHNQQDSMKSVDDPFVHFSSSTTHEPHPADDTRTSGTQSPGNYYSNNGSPRRPSSATLTSGLSSSRLTSDRRSSQRSSRSGSGSPSSPSGGSSLGPGAGGPLSVHRGLGSADKRKRSRAQIARDHQNQVKSEKERAKAEADLKSALEAAKLSASKTQIQQLSQTVTRDRVHSVDGESSAGGGSESLENTISNLNRSTTSLSMSLPSHKRRRFLDNEPPPVDAELFCTLVGRKLLDKSKQLCNTRHSPTWMQCLSPDVNLYLHHQLSALDAAYEWCSHMAYCFDNAAKQAEDDQRAEMNVQSSGASGSNPYRDRPDVEVRVEVAPFPPPASRRQCPLTLQEIVVSPPKIYLFTAWKMILFPGPQDELASARGEKKNKDPALKNPHDPLASIPSPSSTTHNNKQQQHHHQGGATTAAAPPANATITPEGYHANQHGHIGASETGRIGPLTATMRNKRRSNESSPASTGRGDRTSNLVSARRSSLNTSSHSSLNSPNKVTSLAGGIGNILSTGDDTNYARIHAAKRKKLIKLQLSSEDDANNNNDGDGDNNESFSSPSPNNNNNQSTSNNNMMPNLLLARRSSSIHYHGGTTTNGGDLMEKSGMGFGESIFGESATTAICSPSSNGSPYSIDNDQYGSSTTGSPLTRNRGVSMKNRKSRAMVKGIPGYKPGYLIRQQALDEENYVVPYSLESQTILSNLGSATGKELMSVASNIDAWTLAGVDDTKPDHHHATENNNTSNKKISSSNKHSGGGIVVPQPSRLLDTPVMSLTVNQMLSTAYILKKFPVFNPRSNNFVVPIPQSGVVRVTCESIKDSRAKAEAFRQLARIAMTSRRFILFETIGIALRKAATFSKKMHLSSITAEAQLSGTVLISQKEGKRGSAFMAGAVRLFREDNLAKTKNMTLQAEEDARKKEQSNIHNDPGRVIRRFFSEVPCALSAPATWGEDLKSLQLRFSGSEANDKADRLALDKATDAPIPAQPTEVSPIAKQLQFACETFTIDLKMELMRMLRVACLPSYLAEVPPDVSEELLLLDMTSRMRRPSNRSRMTPDQQQTMFNEAMRQLQVEHDGIANRRQNPALQPVDAAVEDWPPKLVLRPDVIPEGLC